MEETFGTILASNIKAERVRAGFNQTETAEMLGITRQQYCKYETDATGIKMIYAVKLSRYFKCNINAFLLNLKFTNS